MTWDLRNGENSQKEGSTQVAGFVLLSNTNIDKRSSIDNSALDRKQEATGDFMKVSSCRLAKILAILFKRIINQSVRPVNRKTETIYEVTAALFKSLFLACLKTSGDSKTYLVSSCFTLG